MQIWLDTIDESVICDAADKGLLAGITTNPSILAQAQQIKSTLITLLELQDGPVAVQVTSVIASEMLKEGHHIAKMSDRFIVKVPANNAGISVIRQLTSEGIPVMATGVFNGMQALVAAHQGAVYIAPYFAHIGERDIALAEIRSMQKILHAYGYSTQILVAALRGLDDLNVCAQEGVAAVTVKNELYWQLISDAPQWGAFASRFAKDWQQSHGPSSIIDHLPN